MQSLQKNKTTIVHSGMGRKPSIIIYYMEKYFQEWKVLYRPFDDELENSYDVLIWFEPPFESNIEKHDNIKCMIVFTSHLDLNHKETIITLHSKYPNYKLLRKKFEQDYEEFETVIIKPKPFRDETFIEMKEPSFVYIDLTHCHNKHIMYLCLLNALENLQYYSDFIEKWKLSNNALPFSKYFQKKRKRKENTDFQAKHLF